MQGLETNPDSAVDAFCREMLGIFKDHQLVRRQLWRITSLMLEEAYKVQDGTSRPGYRPAKTRSAGKLDVLAEQFNSSSVSPSPFADG
jgi:hypothetical protein